MNNILFNDSSFFYLFINFLFVGIIFFLILMLAMVFLFGFSMKSFIKKPKETSFLIILLLFVPLATSLFSQKSFLISTKAASKVKIVSLEKILVGGNSLIVNLTTSEPAIVYLLIKDAKLGIYLPVLPTHSLEKRTAHNFLLSNTKDVNIKFLFVINGEKYELNNQSLIIGSTK